MKLTKNDWLRAAGMALKTSRIAVLLIAMSYLASGAGQLAMAQAVSTTTVQGTVYLANGKPGSGTLRVSWPGFSTASGQTVVADSTTVTIGPDGFVSVNLAPNLGATPAGLYYTAVLYMSDGSVNTQYWVVPAAAQASLAQVQAQVMPAAQAVQAVNKAYVDQAITQLGQSQLGASGGTLTGPLFLSGDPTQPSQAADKHYVDSAVSQTLPIGGGVVTGPLTAVQLGAAYQVDQFAGADFGAKLQACLNGLSAVYGGTCDARNFTGTLAMASNVTISAGNTTVDLPCATITTASQVMVPAGTRNVALHGCALRGGSAANGSQGGTVFAYSGSSAMVQVGDATYAVDTQGFHMDNLVINTTAALSGRAQGFVAFRTQEMDLESLYFLGNSNQTGMTLDGTGNYTGGTFYDNAFDGFQTAVNAIGHQVANSATTDWVNASTFVRLHIDCPTSSGNPIAGTYGINLQQGDGNTFTGGDVEGCGTALHLGANAQNNTVVGLRNENSSSQVVADAGSAYNNWITGGTMFTGKLTDNGTRNSFLDTFHRSFNGVNGDWYGSQLDATLTNHYRLGTGSGNERGLLNRYQTDYGYRWTMGLSDATAGEQFYQVLDELNNVYRLSIGQYNNGQSNTNDQTVINSAGSGAVVLNGSSNSGTGGLVIGSGGPSASSVATISNSGNAQFNGTLQVGGTSTFTGTATLKNQADAEVDQILWAGATTGQKESLTYKDWNGNSQWYAMKDASNNWALNSAVGGVDSFKAYQSTNSGDTYVDASNASGVVRVNYETGAGNGFKVYGGNSSLVYASFTGTTSIQFPGLAASSGHNCVQIDSSGYVTNTGAACGSGSGSGTVNAGNSGQIAYYTANGTSIGGMSAVPLTSGGTGATSAQGAIQNLGGISSTATSQQTMAGPLNANVNGVNAVTAFGAKGDCTGAGSTASCTDNHAAIQAAVDAAYASGGAVYFPSNVSASGLTVYYTSQPVNPKGVSLYGPPGASGPSNNVAPNVAVRGAPGKDVFAVPDPTSSGYVSPHYTYSVEDLAILVDDTVNASSSFPHRFPGKHCFDVTANGTTVITSAAQCEFRPGDVGQAIQVGSTVTTIATWQSNTQVTLAATVPSGTNQTTYVSVMNLPVTQTIGNCGWAYDEKDNSENFHGPNKSLFRNVLINSIDNAGSNYTCGYFFQGERAPYHTRWELGYVGGTFGFAFVPADVAAPSTGHNTGLGDVNVFDNLWIGSNYPWISYDGGQNQLRSIQISGGIQGPHILSAYGVETIPGGWDIDLPEMEDNISGCAANNIGFRIDGDRHLIHRLSPPGCQTANFTTLQWDASNTIVESMQMPSLQAFNITGNLNQLNAPNGVGANPSVYSITGAGNTVTTSGLYQYFQSTPTARRQFGGGNSASVGPAQLSRGSIAFDRTHDFIDKGAANYFLNSEDLWVWPDEITCANPVVRVNDSLSDTGRALQTDAAQACYLDASNGTAWTIGAQFPAGKMRVYVKARATTASASWYFTVGSGASSTNLCVNNSITLSTSYPTQPYYCDIDTTGLAGQQLKVQIGQSPSGNPVNVAWFAFRPYDTDTLSTSLKIGSGTPMTGNHGTGAYVQHSDGTGTSGNLASFNSDGSVSNGPMPPSGAIVGTTDSQTLTNKSITGSEINSGTVGPAFGGTGQNESSATGVGQWSSGTYSVSNALANGTTATTQAGGDNSTKVATTAYVASPGAIAPTTVTASGLIAGGNDTIRTTAATIGTTSFTTTGLVLPTVPTSSTRAGRCVVYWQMSSTSYTATFGMGMSNTPAGLWGGTSVTYASGGTSNWLAFSQTGTAATAVSTAATAGAANTTYRAEIDFTLQTGATNPVAPTVYGQVSNASATLTIEPGSACYWLP